MTRSERLRIMDSLLQELVWQLRTACDQALATRRARSAAGAGPVSLPVRDVEEMINAVGNVQVHVGLIEAEGDLEVKGWNAAIDAVQDMGKNASYLQAGEFVGLLEHVRKPVVEKVPG